jgi:hypothetical protein
MNLEDTTKAMVEAAATAAKAHWNDLRGFAEQEFRRLSAAGAQIKADLASDLIDAKSERDPASRAELQRQAKRRAQLAFEGIEVAAGGVVSAASTVAKIAAQDAVNAALDVLRSAINQSIGFALL